MVTEDTFSFRKAFVCWVDCIRKSVFCGVDPCFGNVYCRDIGACYTTELAMLVYVKVCYMLFGTWLPKPSIGLIRFSC